MLAAVAALPAATGGGPWTAAVPGPAVLAAQEGGGAAEEEDEDPLLDALEAHRHPVALEEGRLTGPGGDLLLRNASDARYLLVGETHGVAEAPAVMSALFRQLQPAGYRHLAVEIGPIQAGKLNEVFSGPRPMEAHREFLADHWPGVPFYGWQEEARLLADAVAAVQGGGAPGSGAGRSDGAGGDADGSDAPGVIWGLDYDIMGDRYPLRRLRRIAPDSSARAAADRAIALADSMLEAAQDAGDLSRIMMFRGPDSVWTALRDAYAPAEGSEADRILDQLAATARINAAWMAGDRFRSNRLRVRLIKRNFLRYRREASPEARVMVKLGGFHVMRGRTPNNTFDIGNFLSELSLAEARDRPETLTAAAEERSFHVVVLGGPGRERATVDQETLGVREVPTVLSSEEYRARALGEAAYGDRWTVFDLRALRPLVDAGELGEIPDDLEEMIFAYDAAVVLVGSTPARMVDVPRR
jgi:hypothetical protein